MENYISSDILMHYGMPRRSGRYPWGSGENPYQHSGDFLARVEELKKLGMSDTEIAREIGLTTSQFRTQRSLANDERRALQVETAKGLRDKGYSLGEIADKMGFKNDSSVRNLLNEKSEARMRQSQVTADFLKEMVDKKGMVDVGAGVELELGVSREKLKEALYILEMQGYHTYGGGIPQVTNRGRQTNTKVLCPPGVDHKDIYDWGNVHSVREYDKILSEDGSVVRPAFEYPESLDSKRLSIRYSEEGGLQKDGVIEIRRGVKDLDLGESHYAQVRIMVDGTHYLKGMAVYSDNMPPGKDIIFNTNKSVGTPMEKVLKPIKDDPDNPFGSLIKEHGGQSHYIGDDGKEHLSLINKRADEGDWGSWGDKIPSQFLSKQKQELIDRQLAITKQDRVDEFNEIMALTNPTVKKALLKSFADDCDAAAVHLKAAALPRQKYQVILPLTTIKETEIYAPNYISGEKVALVRYPHGGTFEIPILTVNNKLPEGKRVLGANPKDAVGISSKVAERLSGADFDGDTVMVIPTGGKVNITSTPQLRGLIGFDPKIKYGATEVKKDPQGKEHYYRDGREYKIMKATQTEMGKVSNLITDMTIKGATESELARAVRHSMVVIDAEKHKLDYKQSERDNGIASLKKKYQFRIDADGTVHEGASTLISQAKGEVSVDKRRGSPIINPDGSLSYKTAFDLEYVNAKGKLVRRTQKSTKMAETDDAMTLVSSYRTKAEIAYANYANDMKALAKKARVEMLGTGKIEYSAAAKKAYANEVESLDAKLRLALMNAPREKEAQRIANTVIKAKKNDNPNWSKKDIEKASQQALSAARIQVGAKRCPVEITDNEWKAIQAGAISENKLVQILNHADIDEVRKRATPRVTTELSDAKKAKIAAMAASGYSNAEIAKAVGVSSSTVTKYL